MKPKELLALDLGSNNWGWCVFYRNDKWEYYAGRDMQYISEGYNEKLSELYSKLKTIFKRYRPDIAAAEHPFARGRASEILHELTGIVRLCCARYGDIPLLEISPQTAKKAITGSGRASKEEVREQAIKIVERNNIGQDLCDAVATAMAAITKII